MSAALEDVRARALADEREKLARRDARIAREVKNRLTTNLKPHIKGIVLAEAEALHVSPSTFARMLMCEALEARGHNLVQALKVWREQNPDEDE